jgi:hypothetical protein
MTEADEQKRIDDEVKKFKNRIWMLNRQNKLIRITGFKLQINRPTSITSVPWWVRIFKRKE